MNHSLQEVDDFITTMDHVTTLEDIFKVLRPQIERLGFERFAYWLMWSPEGKRIPLYINSYPVDWIDHYTDQKYGSDDLVMRYAATIVRPYNWDEVRNKYEFTTQQRLIFSEATDVGLKTGATVPINGPGKAKAVFSVSNNQNREEFAKLFLKTRHALHLFATYTHEKIISLNLHTRNVENIKLTAREIEMLTWVSRGKSRAEISIIVGISEETVKTHIERACGKLNATNQTQAAAIALMNGLILP